MLLVLKSADILLPCRPTKQLGQVLKLAVRRPAKSCHTLAAANGWYTTLAVSTVVPTRTPTRPITDSMVLICVVPEKGISTTPRPPGVAELTGSTFSLDQTTPARGSMNHFEFGTVQVYPAEAATVKPWASTF